MALTNNEYRTPEYDMSFLKKCLRDLEGYITSEEKAKIISAMLGEDNIRVQDLMKEYFLGRIDCMVDTHRVRRRGPRYAINIKVHSLPFTDEQSNFIYENWERVMDRYWSLYIGPWIESKDPQIYCEGRSGGWLVLDIPTVDWDDTLEDAHRAFKYVRDFKNEWNDLLETMKEDLNKVMDEKDDMVNFS
jgi:hypothetical protein